MKIKWLSKLKQRLSVLREVVDCYPSERKALEETITRQGHTIKSLTNRLLDVEMQVKSTTDISVDINPQGANHVIVVGRYKDRDYVQCYDLQATNFADLIRELRAMEKTGFINVVDAPPRIAATIREGIRRW